MKHRLVSCEPVAVVAGGIRGPVRATPALRLILMLLAIVWTQFPFGGGARAEGGRSLELCCAWGRTLDDGELTWNVQASDLASAEVIRSAVREWDDALSGISLIEANPGTRVDITVAFFEAAGRTEGQAVTSFTRRGLIQKVEVTIQGAPAPGNNGGLGQIAKHEFGHALGLGHANHEGNLMSSAVTPQPAPIPACAIDGVIEANRWKMMDGAKRPQRPQAAEVPC